MDRFRRLISLALLTGTVAGMLLFAVQYFAIYPLIEKAERYESAAHRSMPGMGHEDDEGWQPAEGLERTLYTALTTVLTAIAYAAVLFGVISLKPVALDWRKGALWGLAAFVCIDLAPALGLPPQPPGVAVADLYTRQFWWLATVVLTAVGLWLLFYSGKAWSIRFIGLAGLILPHVIGSPVAEGQNFVPAELVHRFIIVSMLTTGLFWVVLGSTGGLLYRRFAYDARP